GHYQQWEQEFDILPQGKIVVSSTSYLGGSWAFTDRCVGNAIRFAGVSLHDAVDMASARPRELLAMPVSRLEPNDPADLVLFNWQEGSAFHVVGTFVQGTFTAGSAER